ncbi:MAG TPA: ABC transporter permease, partial [Dongiaceae bacterium]|nr:ABC transporter permease [Dongiaceae bacterium]
WLGTDEFGRDVLSRILAGASTSVWISAATVICVIILGSAIGIATGYLRGWADHLAMIVNDTLLAFPGILLALGLMAVIGPGSGGIMLALTVAYLPTVVRVVRGVVLSLREREFIEASLVIGNSQLYTMWRHILPNCVAPLTVLATALFGWILLSESALSFLGLGVPPPAPTWGNMLAASRPYFGNATWLGIFPGLCICLALLGTNLFGDVVRDMFDPRMARKRSAVGATS